MMELIFPRGAQPLKSYSNTNSTSFSLPTKQYTNIQHLPFVEEQLPLEFIQEVQYVQDYPCTAAFIRASLTDLFTIHVSNDSKGPKHCSPSLIFLGCEMGGFQKE